MGWELLQHLLHSPDLAPSNFHLFGPQSESLGVFSNIVFKNFYTVPTKNLMLWVPADLENNGNTAVNCREIMLKINLTVRNV